MPSFSDSARKAPGIEPRKCTKNEHLRVLETKFDPTTDPDSGIRAALTEELSTEPTSVQNRKAKEKQLQHVVQKVVCPPSNKQPKEECAATNIPPNDLFGKLSVVKRRKRMSEEHFKLLETRFKCNTKPNTETRAALAEELSMTPRAVQVWLQNRRAEEKQLNQVKSRKREQSRVLETAFERTAKLDAETKAALAEELSMEPKAVARWFYNRRSKGRRLKHVVQKDVSPPPNNQPEEECAAIHIPPNDPSINVDGWSDNMTSALYTIKQYLEEEQKEECAAMNVPPNDPFINFDEWLVNYPDNIEPFFDHQMSATDIIPDPITTYDPFAAAAANSNVMLNSWAFVPPFSPMTMTSHELYHEILTQQEC